VPDTPDLHDLLHRSRWRERFDDEILAAAGSLVSKVRELRCEQPETGTVILRANVGGGETEVTAWRSGDGWDLESSCSCDLGGACHHAAAMLLRAARETRGGGRLAHQAVEGIRKASELPSVAAASGSNLPRLEFPPRFELHVTRESADRHTRLLFKSLGQPEPETMIVAAAWVIYDGHRSPLRASAPDWVSTVTRPDGSRATLHHQAGLENTAAQQLRDSGLSTLRSNPAWRFILNLHARQAGRETGDDRWFPDPGMVAVDDFWFRFRGEWVARLEAEGWTVTIDDNVGHRVFDAGPDEWDSTLEAGAGGWFSLSVGFDVGGRRHDLLPILVRLLDSDLMGDAGERPADSQVYVPLPGGDALRLPAARVRTILHHLAALLDPKFPERTRLHPLDAATVAGLAELGVAPPPELAALAAKLSGFSGIALIEPAAGVRATLRDYQLAGFRWMRFLADHGLHGILADDMGLGKTLQTLTHILTEKDSGRSGGRPALVVAPTSVVPNWKAEAAKFTPTLRTLVLTGPERGRYFSSIPHADLVLTSFALLQRDIDRLATVPFHIAVLDEAQNIKNPQAKVAQAAGKLRAAHRLCLSGTPVENHLGELWSLMRFLMPGFLGSEELFNTRYRKPIEKDGDAERNAALKRRLAPLILRRTKDQVATELPPKTELVHLIELHSPQKDLYETVRALMDKRVRQAIAARGLGQSQIVFLDALLKLRQICCDPRLLPDEFSHRVRESAKLDFLTELLDLLLEEGRRILIFSQFTTMLALIAEHLDRVGISYLTLTGSSRDRGALVAAFQTGRVPLFLISLKAGGTGLNLTAADTVIHYDPWWNPAAEAQATDRAYRIGQDKPVFVHKLLCQDTVEQRIHQLQLDKGKLAAGILADAGLAATLDSATVRGLLEA
jgi:hypothetical protein